MNTDQTIASDNLPSVEELYTAFLQDPSSFDPTWQDYFSSVSAHPSTNNINHFTIREYSSSKIEHLIDFFRTEGHAYADINSILLPEARAQLSINLDDLGFSQHDLSISYPTHGLLKQEEAPLEKILEQLKSIYCDRIGFEFKELKNKELENWIQERIESPSFRDKLSEEQKKIILEELSKSSLFESFLHTKYVGQKRFSLEGAETLIPMLSLLMDNCAESGVEEIVIGMAHRGRLNVLSNILKKSYNDIFAEFDENYMGDAFEGAGDVKYHQGHTSNAVETHSGKKIKIAISPNPSHLESVAPVVEGKARAKQKIRLDTHYDKVIPILIHGDAALSGQGVVYETLQLSRHPGFTTGGTIHFVINNQIGFTTVPKDLRSTQYCTDIARPFDVPVFHVNVEDPEGCVLITLLAFEIRQRFHCDVFIDLNCYRKYGHNESDEPAFTQPLEYQIIRNKPSVREIYRDTLIKEGVVDKNFVDMLESEFKDNLQKIFLEKDAGVKTTEKDVGEKASDVFSSVSTTVSKDVLVDVAQAFSLIPSGFTLHPKLLQLTQERLKMVTEDRSIDWGMAEYLAYATLLWEGHCVRISGQDCERGTFSHRHAIWVDQKEEKDYFPLAHLKEGQGKFEIYNSILSEFAVLGFEYGFSVAYPEGLTIWEAQFGDFCNGAQTIIDQYIVSGEQKWGQTSNLTMFLPHGYEGQGPEHSSARLERFLTLASHDNMQIVYPTTPAQFFHLLRRQVLKKLIKPLIVFTPKGLLRHPACISHVKELVEGEFNDLIDDPERPLKATKLLLCSGRIYYDLIEKRLQEKRNDCAIIRIEQLYPFNEKQFLEKIAGYPVIQECVWVQEEHQNMGAWEYIRPHLHRLLPKDLPLRYVGRVRSATPATGSHAKHKKELSTILNQVFQS